ncbi:MAG: phage tail protein [Desulfuromonadales bacterium]|nr:phage tail protein [Desulfuromonadales bacterium]
MKKNTQKRLSVRTTLILLASLLLCQPVWADDPFIGEVRWVAFDFAPRGWAKCDGSLIPISSNAALFSLLGTTYGGNGTSTFALPDLRGRAPIHVSYTANSYHMQGETGGEESHMLTTTEMPAHTHPLKADPAEATATTPGGLYLAKTSSGVSAYGTSPTISMSPNSIAGAGNGASHNNMKPFVAMTCIIATSGVFPTRP